MELSLATTNPGKLREFADLFGSDRFTWRTLGDFPKLPPVEETGHTFRANAILKAAGYAQRHWANGPSPTTAALKSPPSAETPAIHKRRSLGSRAQRRFRRFRQQRVVTYALYTNFRRKSCAAQFVCVLAFSQDPTGQIILTARDTVVGRILRAAVGSNGFGYDPLFYVDAYKRTTAELSPTEKHQISHRGKAFRRLKNLLDRIDLANVIKDGYESDFNRPSAVPGPAQKVVEPLADLASRISAEVLVVHVSRPSGGQMREQEQADGESAISLLRRKTRGKSGSASKPSSWVLATDIARSRITNTRRRARRHPDRPWPHRQKCLRPPPRRQRPRGTHQKHKNPGPPAPPGFQRVDLTQNPRGVHSKNPDTIEIIGAVAQLGEHRVCNAGVASSNLVGSIPCPLNFGAVHATRPT